ncbi:MAG: SoxR reducing system RseC family protein [Gallionella sp.]|nr:SoxR reducing system RseC family protein [Gallionella sp.]
MLETRAIVVQVDGKHAFVQANQGNGCGQCSGKGCGTGKLSQLFCSKPRQFQVDNSINARVGDEVIVSVAEGAVLRGIGLVYLLPLLLLITGATLGSLLATQPEQSDVYAATGAFSGLAAGFIFAKWSSSHRSHRQNLPYIARQCGEDDA